MSSESSNFSVNVAGVSTARPLTLVGSCRFMDIRHGKIVFETLKFFFVNEVLDDLIFAFGVLQLAISGIEVVLFNQNFVVLCRTRFSGLCGNTDS